MRESNKCRRLYIADWHYGHKNILSFDNRPFKTVEEMNAALIDRWNKTVFPGDIVYMLGDMFLVQYGRGCDCFKIFKRSEIFNQRKSR